LARGAQVADEQLALDLEPHDEEEERHQAIGDPIPQGLADLQDARHPNRQLGLPEALVAHRQRGVGQH
jgi:hypothetical protein